MSKIGFIGTGSMGQILIHAFIRSGALNPTDTIIHNRTRRKAEHVASEYPGIRVADNNVQLVSESDLIFICVKPLEYGQVLSEIKDATQSDQIVVTITSPISITDVSSRIRGKVVKVIPSITSTVNAGTSLIMFHDDLSSEERQRILQLFEWISRPLEIDERDVRIASDLASSGPAYLSCIAELLARSAIEVTQLPKDIAHELVNHMIHGTGKLLTEGHFTLTTLQERVAVPGGVTREGIDFIQQHIGTMFDELFRMTQTKHQRDLEHVRQMFERLY